MEASILKPIKTNKMDTSDWTLEEKISQAAQMRVKGMKLQEIADQFEVDKGTISRWLNKYDDLAQQMEQVAKEKEEVTQQYWKLRESFTFETQQNGKLQADNATLQIDNEQLMQHTEKLQIDIATLESKITTTNNDNATLLQQLEKLQIDNATLLSGGERFVQRLEKLQADNVMLHDKLIVVEKDAQELRNKAQQGLIFAQEKELLVQKFEKLEAEHVTLQKKLDEAVADNYKAYEELEAAKEEAITLSQQLKASHLQMAKNRLKRMRSGKELRAIFLKENVLISFMVLIALALAVGVTGPVYESAGIYFLVALALGFGTDFAGMLFIYRKVKRFEWMFAISIILQVGIKLGVPPEYKFIFAEITVLNKAVGLDAFQIARAVITALSLGVAVYGLGKARAANE